MKHLCSLLAVSSCEWVAMLCCCTANRGWSIEHASDNSTNS